MYPARVDGAFAHSQALEDSYGELLSRGLLQVSPSGEPLSEVDSLRGRLQRPDGELGFRAGIKAGEGDFRTGSELGGETTGRLVAFNRLMSVPPSV